MADARIEVLNGEQTLNVLRLKLDMPEGEGAARVALDGKAVPSSAVTEQEWTELRFEKPLHIAAGQVLTARMEA